jgi:hypothetical protein
MRYLSLLIACLILFSCHARKDKRLNNFVSKVDSIGLNKFKNIEYTTRGELESYDYYISADSSINLTYNPDLNDFQFPKPNPNFAYLINDSLKYMQDLSRAIRSLNVIMITQSPWIGNIIRFWISDDEIISYVNPDFKFDDRYKKEWRKELKTGYKFKENWYYLKFNKNAL